jgi:hypothetical protein
MESCVEKVMKQGHDKSSAIAICHKSIVSESRGRRLVDKLVGEMTTTAAIATVPMGFASDSEMETTPRDSEIVAAPTDLGPDRKK